MTASRIQLAFPEGHPSGDMLVIGASGNADLTPLDPSATTIIQRHFSDHQTLLARGYRVASEITGRFQTAIVILPRSKAAARANIADAVTRLEPGGALWIDGQKTDGVDAILKELRKLVDVGDIHSKAHGKIFRVTSTDADWLPKDWVAKSTEVAPGYATRPGVFSADGIDPGSELLIRNLPERMPTRIVDLGAGWGWLSGQVLARPGIEVIHLVEADHAALESARDNVTDPRAKFHWADAREFRLPDPVNGVIMNPPFHNGRDSDPRLGAAFIATAAGLLTGAGKLWMVANRHLPYETVLREHFAQVTEIGGDNRYKIFEAGGAGRGSKNQRGRK